MNIQTEVKVLELIENNEVADILDWWNDTYGYQLLKSEQGLTRLDLQTSEQQTTNIMDMVRFYITEIKNKLEYESNKRFSEELEVLINYLI